MKTAEVAIEYILTGLLALCAFVLPFLPEQLNFQHHLIKNEALFGLLGLAYPIGIIFDKLADMALAPIEQYLRLKQAGKHIKNNRECFKGDPFPQDTLENYLRQKQDGRLEWMDSLRSRIRVSRSLAVFGLPAAMGIVIYLILMKESGSQLSCLLVVAVVNLLLLVGSIFPVSKFSLKTHELYLYECDRNGQLNEAKNQMWRGVSLYSLILFVFTVTIVMLGCCGLYSGTGYLIVGIIGAIVSLFALWSWYKITETYMKFLYHQLPKLITGDINRPKTC